MYKKKKHGSNTTEVKEYQACPFYSFGVYVKLKASNVSMLNENQT